MRQSTDDKASLFGISKNHTIKLRHNKRVKQADTWYETQWFDEYDARHKLIARFRCWTNQSVQPPYRKQLGWERYSLSGNLLDREVRYNKRQDNDYVH